LKRAAFGLLAGASPGSEYFGVEVGGRSVGGDAVGGGNVRLWRKRRGSRLLCDHDRRRLWGDGLRRPVGGRRSCSLVWCRACRRRSLLHRRDRLRRDGFGGLGRGCCRCRGGWRLARAKDLGVEVSGGTFAAEAVRSFVGLLALTRGLGRRGVIGGRAPGSGDCDRGKRGGGPDARQYAVQDVPPVSIVPSNKGRIWRRQGKLGKRRGVRR
jgi:hypothetical protein